jgi:hypothetical protein
MVGFNRSLLLVMGIDREFVIIYIEVVSTYTYDISYIVLDQLHTPLVGDLGAILMERSSYMLLLYIRDLSSTGELTHNGPLLNTTG